VQRSLAQASLLQRNRAGASTIADQRSGIGRVGGNLNPRPGNRVASV
jgi:hypothetical protein